MADESFQTYPLGDFPLQSGAALPSAHLAYKTLGSPTNPTIIYPTWYSGAISDNLWLISTQRTLNPEKYHIVIPALFGNGQSTSPSNTDSNPFPHITFHDNIRAQHQLLTQHLHIDHVYAVVGWSMGAGQCYQWATQHPTFMDKIVPFCGSARTSLHNQVFLEGVKTALLAAKGIPSAGVCADGTPRARTWSAEERETGLKALGRVYAGWGFSQTFYRQQLYLHAPAFKGMFTDLEDFMVKFWEAWALSKDPENMLTMLWTWQSGDVSRQEPYMSAETIKSGKRDEGAFEKALGAVRAEAMVMPCRTDMYFPPEDSEIEVAYMPKGKGKLEVFASVWGHWAGGPGQSLEDVEFLDGKLREFLG